METKFERVADDDPHRCQSVVGGNDAGQCHHKAVEGGTMCLRHGGNKQLNKIEKDSADMYRVDMWKAKIARMANHPEVKSLGSEIGLLRMLMEEKLRACTNDTELLLASPGISDLVMKIEKVVFSCNKLEKSMGQHLDKAALLQFASRVVAVIAEIVTDKDQVQSVADGILQIIGETEGDDGSRSH